MGYYEGDTLVIDPVGVKSDRPLAMLDMYGTPYTQALHVVERYRLLDYEVAKEGLERDAKERNPIPNTSMQVDKDRRGKYLQLSLRWRIKVSSLCLVRNRNLWAPDRRMGGRCLRRRHAKHALLSPAGSGVPDCR